MVVGVDKEAHRSPQGLQRPAKTATAPGQAFEIGSQVRLEALTRVGFFFAHRTPLFSLFGPDQFGRGGLSIAGIAGRRRHGIYHRLQGGEAVIQAHLLAHHQPRGARDGDDEGDFVFFSRTYVERSSSSIVSAGMASVTWAGKALAASVIQLLTL